VPEAPEADAAAGSCEYVLRDTAASTVDVNKPGTSAARAAAHCAFDLTELEASVVSQLVGSTAVTAEEAEAEAEELASATTSKLARSSRAFFASNTACHSLRVIV
jgi:hypothetical protein